MASLVGLGLKFLLPLIAIGGLWWMVNNAAYNRGFSARDAEARKVIAQMEQRMAERLKKNEGLTPDELDCELIRLRNPKAECP